MAYKSTLRKKKTTFSVVGLLLDGFRSQGLGPSLLLSSATTIVCFPPLPPTPFLIQMTGQAQKLWSPTGESVYGSNYCHDG